MEQWRDIKDYEGLYQVSNYGNVRSLDRIIKYSTKEGKGRSMLIKGTILKPLKINSGYLRVNLSKNNKVSMYLIHRLVAEAFIEKDNGCEYVNHKNENKTDNRAANLEWVSFIENIRYGTGAKRGHSNRDYSWFHEHRGSKSPSAKPIIQLDKNGNTLRVWPCAKDAARELGVCYTSICDASRGRRGFAGGFKWKYKTL